MGIGARTTHRWLSAAEVLAVGAAALVARLAYPSLGTHTDEHFHLLAARSLLHDATLRITPEAPLPYDRAWLYTYAVAGCQWLLGETVWAARLPSALCGVLLIVAMFAFLRRHADRGAAWIASLLLGFSLPALQMSAMCRFYMPHALAVWLAAWAAFELVARGRWANVGWWVLLLASVAAGFHLQDITAIACGALGLWAIAFVAWGMFTGQRQRPRPIASLAVAGLAIAGLAAFFVSGFAAHLWDRYTTPRLWAADSAGDWRYYHRGMLAWRPLFYAALPLAVLFALRVRPAVTWWAAAIFAVPYVTHSLISPKAERYVFYTLPFFFTVWGVAGAAVMRDAYDTLHHHAPRLPGVVRVGVVLLAVAPAAAWLMPEYRTTAALLRGRTDRSPYREPDWAGVHAALAHELRDADLVIGSSGQDELFHLGRCDAVLNASAVAGQGEFFVMTRLGRPAISTVESLNSLIDEHPTGLVLIARSDWRDETHVTPAVSNAIDATLERLPDPARDVRAYRWPPRDPVPAPPAESDRP